MGSHRRALVALLLAALLCVGVFGAVALLRSGPAQRVRVSRPNIVVIIDDDQTDPAGQV